MLRFLVASILFLAITTVNGAVMYVNETGWWFNGGSFNPSATPIQSAIDNASDGDIIYIKPGHYYENVDILNKVVSIIGEGKPGEIVVEATANDAVFYVRDTRDQPSAEFLIKNVTIIGKPYCLGIYVDDFYGYSGTASKTVSIENVNVTFPYGGYGIEVENSTWVTISNANVNESQYGVWIRGGSSDVIVEFSKISSINAVYVDSSHAEISNNEIKGTVRISYYSGSLPFIVSDNVINNSGTNKDGIHVTWTSGAIEITNNDIEVGGGTGISIASSGTSSTVIFGNEVTGSGSGTGIYVSSSRNVNVERNFVSDLNKGLHIASSSNVVVDSNVLRDNTYNFGVYDTNGDRLKTIVVTNTTANGRPVYYFVGVKDLTIPTDASTAYCVDCSGVLAKDLNLNDNIHGLFFYNCSNVTILDITIGSVGRGVDAYYSHNVSISNSSVNFSDPEDIHGTAVSIQYSDDILIYNTSMIDELDSGSRTGLNIQQSNDVIVMDSKLVCHSRPLVGYGFEISYSQNVHIENFYADTAESKIDANYYDIIDSNISGTLHVSGSYALMANCKLENLDVGASNADVRECSMNYANLDSSRIGFEDNVITNYGPISYDGLRILGEYCYVANNVITGAGKGTGVWIGGSGNELYNNSIAGFSTGVYFVQASNNTLITNEIENCKYGIKILADELEDYFNHIDTSNTINGDPILYVVNESGGSYAGSYGFVGVINCTNVNLDVYSTQPNYHGVVIAYTNDSSVKVGRVNSSSYYGVFVYNSYNDTVNVSGTGSASSTNKEIGVYAEDSSYNEFNVSISGYYHGIELYGSNNNTLTGTITNCCGDGIYIYQADDNTIIDALVSNCNYGIQLSSSNDNAVRDSKITLNIWGIRISSSDNNTITGNYIQNNYYGIYLSNSNDNVIYNNYLSNTYWNARTYYSTNDWNVSERTGSNILGGNLLGGNYWSDYTGADSDGDGFGDTPYVIDSNNIDYLPLVSTYHKIDILVLGTPLINQSTLGILKVRFVNFSYGDPYEITIYDPSNAVVYRYSGTLAGDNVTVDIDWIPKVTGNHTVQAYAQGTIDSATVNVYQYVVVAPVPEIVTLVLVALGTILILRRRF